MLNSSVILKVLAAKHRPPNEVFYPELRIGTGFGVYADQRIDAFAMHLHPSKGMAKVAYEIKVSRGDFLSELKKPTKRKMALLFSDYFYFATPRGLVSLEELPPECGLIEVFETSPNEYGHQVTVKAPRLEAFPPNWRLVGSICRRAYESELKQAFNAKAAIKIAKRYMDFAYGGYNPEDLDFDSRQIERIESDIASLDEQGGAR